MKGRFETDKAVDLFDEFMRLFKEESYFKEQKMQQLKEMPETLSSMEMLAITIISGSNDNKQQMHDEMTDELDYDPYNPILYATDNQIKETLLNLFIGEFIHQVLEMPNMKPVKVRQKEQGKIANIDKPIVIENIKGVGFLVKMAVLLGRGELAFEEYIKFNTNISSRNSWN